MGSATVCAMANPAERLAWIFKDWKLGGGSNHETRRGMRLVGPSTDQHLNAMECLAAIRNLIRELEAGGRDMSWTESLLPIWVRAVIIYPEGWKEGTNADALITDHALDGLRWLADTIRSIRPQITPEQHDRVMGLLDDIDELRMTDESVPEDLREYIHRLTQHARNCVEDYEALRKFDITDAIERLWVALRAAEGYASEETKSRWRRAWESIRVPAGAALLGNAPSIALNVAMLTQGGPA